MAFLCCPFVFECSVGIGIFGHRTESDLLLSLFVRMKYADISSRMFRMCRILLFITLYVCVIIFMASPHWLAVGPRSLYGGLFTNV